MKLKQIAIAACSTLYMGAVAASAVTLPEVKDRIDLPDLANSGLPDNLKQTRSFEHQELPTSTESKSSSVNRITGLPLVGGVNQHMSQPVKFTPEEGIEGEHRYFITLQDRPVAQYTGGIAGLAATNLATVAKQGLGSSIASADGQIDLRFIKKSDAYQTRVEKYKHYLRAKQDSFINAASSLGYELEAETSYDTAINAITVVLTQQQAAHLAELASVKNIHRVTAHQVQTLVNADNDVTGAHDIINTHHIWELGAKGEGIIVGVSDTGINTDHPSFVDFGGQRFYTDDSGVTWEAVELYDHVNPWGEGNYVGDCNKHGFEHMCNDKLIGVRSYERLTDQYSKTDLINHMLEERELSYADLHSENGRYYAVPPVGEDHAGHGSHTAGTAAGNAIKDVHHLYRAIEGPGLKASEQPIGNVSGVAPRANIIAYQVCISANSNSGYAGCLADVMVEALEDAIEDGVDVMNWSLGGAPYDAWENPLGQAFLSARESGMHIAVSAGNNGYQGSVKHAAPWIMTVGATQTNRRERTTSDDRMTTGSVVPASIDGEEFPINLSQAWYNISGHHEDGRAVLGEFMGACVEDDCSEGPVCKVGYEMLDDDLCYLECKDDEFRDPDTLSCDSFEIDDLPDQKDPANCLIGTEWVAQDEVGSGQEWGCLDINRNVPTNYTTRESICLSNDDVIFPSLTDAGSPYEQKSKQRFYCPDVEVDDAHPNYRGRLGGSKGVVCAYGVEPYMETEFNNGFTWNNKNAIVYWDGDSCKDSEEENCVPEDRDGDGENSTIDEPTLGQCRVRAPADRDVDYSIYENSTGPGASTDSFGVIANRPVITDYKAPAPTFKGSSKTPDSSVQSRAVGLQPEMRVFEGDRYCENLHEWRDPHNPQQLFDFDNAVVFCARGNGNNISYLQKSKNVIEVAERDAELAGRASDEMQASIVVYNDVETYGSVYQFPANIPFVNVRFDSWVTDFAPFFKGGDVPSSLTELQKDRRITLSSQTVEVVPINEDDERINNTLANFTSKGPHYYQEDLMPVQVMAPGVNIYAPWTDNAILDKGWNSADWAFNSGTSMATPVVAGTLAILKQVRPEWTQHERESALTMTSGEVAYRTVYMNENDYDENNPDHIKSVGLVPATDENGELIYDEDGVLVMIEIAQYLKVINVSSWHVGTGIINLKSAINSGLVLDESLDNMIAANPSAGGDARQLNMPYMFDGSCPEVCTWLRTFTAKRAGRWTVNIEKLDAAVQISSSVDSFELSEGETITIMFTAKIDRSIAQDQSDNVTNGTGYTGGEVRLVADDISIPDVRLPVGVSLDNDSLPTLIQAQASSETGRYPVDLSMPSMSTDSMISKVYHQENIQYINTDDHGELAKSGSGVIELQASTGYGQTWLGRVELPLDETKLNFDFATAHKEKSAKLIWVDVPENTKMLAIDVLGKVATNAHSLPELQAAQGTLMMAVGRDMINPGQLDFEHEGTCASMAENLRNFCYIMDPQPGRYWVLMQNVNDSFPGYSSWLLDTYDYAVSVVSDDLSSHMILDAPQTANPAQGALQLDLVYSLPMKKHEARFAVVELFSNEFATAADMGTVPVRLYREDDPVSISFERTRALELQDNVVSAAPGSYMKVNLDVAQNMSGYDRPVSLKVDLPEGITYVRGAISGDGRFVTGYQEMENGEGMELSLYQPNTHRLGKGYVMTTNIDPQDPKNSNHPYVIDGSHRYSAQCRTPAVGTYYDGSSPNGGYVDLAKLNPLYARNMWGEDTYVDLERLFYFDSRGYDVGLYDGPRRHSEFKVSPRGYVSAGMGSFLDTKFFSPLVWPNNEILIAPLMRKGVTYEQTVALKSGRDLLIGESPDVVEGMTMALFADGIEYKAMIEWDNAHTQDAGVRLDDNVDFQAWFDLEHSHLPGKYELIFAYDNVDMMAPDANFNRSDVIGFQGIESDIHFFGLIKAPRREFFAFNNVEEVIHDDLVICYDYYGPDYSASDFSFWVRVDDQSAGEQLELNIESAVGGSVVDQTYIVNVPSQITIGNFNSVVLNQGSSIDVPVFYADSNVTSNTISAYNDNLNLSVDGKVSGSMLTIDANCSFTGDTQIEVEVVDDFNNEDRATATIDVTVLAVAGFDGADCSTSKDSDETSTEEEIKEKEPDSDDSSGGSFGVWMLLFSLLAAVRLKAIKG
ncbi:hypothetical protein E2K93_02805 [Thalassotalea sp. HSM 43]|uniref:S8 family serine peptidase n=1 Tax=Thalassotalea sp. HSM 43 TaxID=2552945 RepID=UPI00107FEA29|nr:S8 family serine peptidase [Thalassotalea sp. HSM 43]QBY03365.1 hypothetical protein E2K93_02805 [Thalassotalea sp. HSM 43]